MSKEKKGKNPKLTAAAKALGSAGGKKGGPARAKALTAEERAEIAKLGGLAHASKKGVKGSKENEAKEKSKEGKKDD